MECASQDRLSAHLLVSHRNGTWTQKGYVEKKSVVEGLHEFESYLALRDILRCALLLEAGVAQFAQYNRVLKCRRPAEFDRSRRSLGLGLAPILLAMSLGATGDYGVLFQKLCCGQVLATRTDGCVQSNWRAATHSLLQTRPRDVRATWQS